MNTGDTQRLLNEDHTRNALQDSNVGDGCYTECQHKFGSCRIIFPMVVLFGFMLLMPLCIWFSIMDAQFPEPLKFRCLKSWMHNRTLYSMAAQRIEKIQNKNCESGNAEIHKMCSFGLGSDFRTWGAHLCRSTNEGKVLLNQVGWRWARWNGNLNSFFNLHPKCDDLISRNQTDGRIRVSKNLVSCRADFHKGCIVKHTRTHKETHAAAIEYLFKYIRSDVVRKAMQVSMQLFNTTCPDISVTVHVRWSDKYKEMELLPISKYVDAVKYILSIHPRKNPIIWLITEDPNALRCFKKYADPAWQVHHNWVPSSRNMNEAHMQEESRCRPPFMYQWSPHSELSSTVAESALVSLLIGLQGFGYVLTSMSNWSFLINALRKNRLESECKNCTYVVDLNSRKWREK